MDKYPEYRICEHVNSKFFIQATNTTKTFWRKTKVEWVDILKFNRIQIAFETIVYDTEEEARNEMDMRRADDVKIKEREIEFKGESYRVVK